MENWRKYLAEFLGTFTLVFLGCGTAMLVGCDSEAGGGYILTALAFGLAIVALAYSVGNISGGHVNPAVSLGFLITKQMSVADFVGYVIAQIFGALFGSAALALIFKLGDVEDLTGGFGTNGLAGVNDSAIDEALLDFEVLVGGCEGGEDLRSGDVIVGAGRKSGGSLQNVIQLGKTYVVGGAAEHGVLDDLILDARFTQFLTKLGIVGHGDDLIAHQNAGDRILQSVGQIGDVLLFLL